MQKRKKVKKRNPTKSARLNAEEISLVKTLLQETLHADPQTLLEKIPNSSVAQAVLENMPTDNENVIPLLEGFNRTFEQKNVQKAVKRAFYKLKQKGIAVPDSRVKSPEPLRMRPAQSEQPTAYLGPIDPTGSRPVLFSIADPPKGLDVGVGVVNDEKGILDFHAGTYSKKRMRELLKIVLEGKGAGGMVETTISHAITVVEAAYALGKEESSEASAAYLSIRPRVLDAVSLLKRPAIYGYVSESEFSAESLTESAVQKLLEHEILASWFIDPSKIEPLIEELLKVRESPILVSEAQRSERIRELKNEWIEKLYPQAERIVLSRRFEEMAYIFYKRDELDFTRLSLVAAKALFECSLLQTQPVLHYLLERTLSFCLETDGQEKGGPDTTTTQSSTSIIVP
jgi:hypothetical protein